MQINRSSLVERVSPYNESIAEGVLPQAWSIDQAAGLSSISREIDKQAAMIAYVDDFALIALMTVLLLPLIALIRPVRREPPAREK